MASTGKDMVPICLARREPLWETIQVTTKEVATVSANDKTTMAAAPRSRASLLLDMRCAIDQDKAGGTRVSGGWGTLHFRISGLPLQDFAVS